MISFQQTNYKLEFLKFLNLRSSKFWMVIYIKIRMKVKGVQNIKTKFKKIKLEFHDTLQNNHMSKRYRQWLGPLCRFPQTLYKIIQISCIFYKYCNIIIWWYLCDDCCLFCECSHWSLISFYFVSQLDHWIVAQTVTSNHASNHWSVPRNMKSYFASNHWSVAPTGTSCHQPMLVSAVMTTHK